MKFIILALLSFASPFFLQAKEVNIESLIKQMELAPIQSVKTSDYIYSERSKKLIRISNPVSQSGTEKELSPNWIYQELDAGFSISLPLSRGYLNPKLDLSLYTVKQCPFSMVSSGKEFIKFDNQNTFIHTWSCGSLGCSFEFIFTSNTEPCS